MSAKLSCVESFGQTPVGIVWKRSCFTQYQDILESTKRSMTLRKLELSYMGFRFFGVVCRFPGFGIGITMECFSLEGSYPDLRTSFNNASIFYLSSSSRLLSVERVIRCSSGADVLLTLLRATSRSRSMKSESIFGI